MTRYNRLCYLYLKISWRSYVYALNTFSRYTYCVYVLYGMCVASTIYGGGGKTLIY